MTSNFWFLRNCKEFLVSFVPRKLNNLSLQCRLVSPPCRGAGRSRPSRGTPSVLGARPPGSPSPASPGTSLSARPREVTWPVAEVVTLFPTWTSPPPGTTSAPLSTESAIPSTPLSLSMSSVSVRAADNLQSSPLRIKTEKDN